MLVEWALHTKAGFLMLPIKPIAPARSGCVSEVPLPFRAKIILAAPRDRRLRKGVGDLYA
jgi:hypothetical protein